MQGVVLVAGLMYIVPTHSIAVSSFKPKGLKVYGAPYMRRQAPYMRRCSLYMREGPLYMRGSSLY